ncbi:hypothetical protein ACPYO6_05785 [Georgenia sp. Z1344]|uniref:hypothetical protein n=1 Tax=Georgenia sp. Z1344 TaxID=3416706 RepID=UPI003CE9DC60
MIVSTKAAAALGCALVAAGMSGCADDQRSVPSMVVAWPEPDVVDGRPGADPTTADPVEDGAADSGPADDSESVTYPGGAVGEPGAPDADALREILAAAGLGSPGVQVADGLHEILDRIQP